MKPSEIAKLSLEELDQQVLNHANKNITTPIELAIEAIHEFDEWKLLKIINDQIALNGFDKVLFEFIIQLLERIGILWQASAITPANEHFASNLIRQKIISVIDQLEPVVVKENKCLLFLPEGEIHELDLLMTHYMLKKRGFHCLYLSSTVPLVDLVDLAKDYDPTYYISNTTNNIGVNVSDYLVQLKRHISSKKTHLTGALSRDTSFEIDPSFNTYSSIKELIDSIAK